MGTASGRQMTQAPKPLVHLITGSTGAGKTTYAMALCEKIGAVRFSIDEWMTKLFWMDSPQPVQHTWALERVDRCEDVIALNVAQLSTLGIPSVLDLGFTRADHRAKFAEMAAWKNWSVQLHFVDVPPKERWQRVCARNRDQGDTFAMNVDRAMFDFMESLWEPPDDAEMLKLNGIRVSAQWQEQMVSGSVLTQK